MPSSGGQVDDDGVEDLAEIVEQVARGDPGQECCRRTAGVAGAEHGQVVVGPVQRGPDRRLTAEHFGDPWTVGEPEGDSQPGSLQVEVNEQGTPIEGRPLQQGQREGDGAPPLTAVAAGDADAAGGRTADDSQRPGARLENLGGDRMAPWRRLVAAPGAGRAGDLGGSADPFDLVVGRRHGEARGDRCVRRRAGQAGEGGS